MCKIVVLPIVLFLAIVIVTVVATVTAVNASDIFYFDQITASKENLKLDGTEQVQLAQTKYDNRDHETTTVSWGEPVPAVISFRLSKPALVSDQFDLARYILTVNSSEEMTIKRIVLRFQDKNNETFQIAADSPAKTTLLNPGDNKLSYTINPSTLTDTPDTRIFGGDANKQIDWPLRFTGLAIDNNAKTPVSKKLDFVALEHQIEGDYFTVQFQTGQRLHLLLPENNANPRLIITNKGNTLLNLQGMITVTDYNSAATKVSLAMVVGPNENLAIPLAGQYDQQGWWLVDYSFQTANGKNTSGTHRFARVDPAGPTSGRAEEFLFGLCGHPERFPAAEGELEALAAGIMGAKIYRVDFSWGRIQPQRDMWNFTVFDRLVDEFGKNGVELEALLGYSVDWAVPESYKPKNPEVKNRPGLPAFDDYAKYCATIAERYKDRIKYFEIWNEPDLVSFANFPATDYMALLQTGYDAIKNIRPDAKIMNGGIAYVGTNRGNPERHNTGLLDLIKEDAGKNYDLFAYHGHGKFANYVNQLTELENLGLVGTDAPRPWYSNETAETSAAIGERAQAVSLFKKMLYAWSKGAMGYNWYLLREKSYYPPGHHERHFGLITVDFEPKPGFVTYNMLANLYGGAEYLKSLDLGTDIHAYLFKTRDNKRALALWNEQPDKPLFLSGLPKDTQVVDIFGNSTALTIKDGVSYLNVSKTPLSLVFAAQDIDIKVQGAILTDNSDQPKFVLNKASDYYSFIPSAPGNEEHYWSGVDDLSAKIWLSRQDDNLRLTVEVNDNIHHQPNRGTTVWQGDNIQFGLRLPGQDNIWKIGLTHLADNKSETFCWTSPGGFTFNPDAIKLATVRDEDKKTTIYKAEIPFAQIGMTREIAQNGFRFNLIVNDNDGAMRKGFFPVSSGMGVGDNDSKWPIINLK